MDRRRAGPGGACVSPESGDASVVVSRGRPGSVLARVLAWRLGGIRDSRQTRAVLEVVLCRRRPLAGVIFRPAMTSHPTTLAGEAFLSLTCLTWWSSCARSMRRTSSRFVLSTGS